MSGVLVVGAGGFLGRAVLAEARRAGTAHAVAGRDVAALPEAHVLRLSSGSIDALAELLRRLQPDAVVNCAGRTSGTDEELRVANVDAVAALIEAVRAGAPDARLVHLGSAAEYAPVTDAATDEDAPTEGVTPYAGAKVAATRLVLDAIAAGLDGRIARVFNPIGPAMAATALPGIAARLLRDAAAGGASEIELGPLDAVRDYVDVRDVATAVHRLATSPDLAHDIYNVGTGRPTVVRTLVRMIADRVGFAGRIGESGSASPRSSGVAFQVARIDRIRSTGWVPTVELADSVDALVAGLPRSLEDEA